MSQQPDPPLPGHPNTGPQQARDPIPWTWEGVLAEEAITLQSAPKKVGKTTLLSLLLDRRRRGGALLGRSGYPGRTVLCSEESRTLWDLRQPPLDLRTRQEQRRAAAAAAADPARAARRQSDPANAPGVARPLARRPTACRQPLAHAASRPGMRRLHRHPHRPVTHALRIAPDTAAPPPN